MEESRVKKGSRGEVRAQIYLRSQGFIIIEKGTNSSPYDILVKKGDLKLAINVKVGKGFMMTEKNVGRLKAVSGDKYIPAFLLEANGSFELFVLYNLKNVELENLGQSSEKRIVKLTKIVYKGATQVPPEIRSILDIKPGNKIVWETDGHHIFVRGAEQNE